MHFPFEEFFPIFPSSHNKWSVVRDESKLPDDSGEVPKPNGVVDGLIPNHEIVPLLDEN